MRAPTTRARRTIVALLLAVLATASAGCAGIDLGTGICTVTADNPHESKGTPGSIVGKARVTCTVSPETLHLEMRLERRGAAGWTRVDGDSKGWTDVTAGRRYTLQAAVPCARGMWRTAARGRGTLDGRTAASAAWTYSQTVTDPCQRPGGG